MMIEDNYAIWEVEEDEDDGDLSVEQELYDLAADLAFLLIVRFS